MRVGHQKKGAKAFLALLVHARETDTIDLAVLKEERGAMNEYQDGGQSSGDACGTHAAEITAPSFAMSGAALSGLSSPNLQLRARSASIRRPKKPPVASRLCATAMNVKRTSNLYPKRPDGSRAFSLYIFERN